LTDNTFLNNLQRQAEENPVLALAVAAGVITSITKLVEAGTNSRNAKAWTREVQRRAIKDSRK
jgi:hypothetical protein